LTFIVGQHEIPPVAAVFASVGHDVAGFPPAILGRMAQEVTTPTAVDAHDRGFRLETVRHGVSVPSVVCVDARGGG
ncbi:MAG: hypothetical protein RLZZ623_2549, partial [Actinomycetota bacterium]